MLRFLGDATLRFASALPLYPRTFAPGSFENVQYLMMDYPTLPLEVPVPSQAKFDVPCDSPTISPSLAVQLALEVVGARLSGRGKYTYRLQILFQTLASKTARLHR